MKAYPPVPRPPAWDDGNFVRGFVASACLSAFQDVPGKPDLRRVARHALQGGTAICAGTLAARALQRQEYSRALLTGMAGALGVMLVERLLRDDARSSQEIEHG
ncbi:hypothetical protein [Pseudomonas schmalbachii]|uniref:Uncharacterized protein n=1 Tax=Pseudomonas schmalbachii TaxID=2816993 RepID=A0ABS3TJT0_9PSED|nr:hypothetical protein [Pseudomonas schmalbachii]MBO3273917.1 hypothetical protein [Pseudomonas schmalbachii]